jgi:hypothetical protein
MDWTSTLIAIVALYGAVLSTYTLVLNRRERSRVLKVEIANGFLPRGPELGPPMLFIGLHGGLHDAAERPAARSVARLVGVQVDGRAVCGLWCAAGGIQVATLS